jgi:hypothetical protein
MPQTNDIDISKHDIQSLNNRDAIYAFLTNLGYDTNNPQKFTDPRSLGITIDSLVREIKSIEQLSLNEGALNLYVYLFELASVTVAHTNALARAFRNKSGNYLFILTSDYERIDFVLVERSQPVSVDDSPMRQKANVVKPRTLTIDRKKPDRRQLRVLRRFTYTESDPIYQYDKLRSAYTIYEWSEDHFNNRALFSDYYLQERLRESDEWKTDVTQFYKDLRGLYGRAAGEWSNKTKQDIEIGLFEKLFPLLGFDFTQKRKPGDGLPKPDYELKAPGSKDTLTVCLCYPWNRNLDGKDDPENSRDTETPDENPSATIVSVLKDNGVQWGIVTNGKLWRLYSAKASSIATTYYEIDLEEILASPVHLGDAGELLDIGDSLRYFYLFFRREAFEEREMKIAGETKTRSFLDTILDDSREYAKKLGERLKDRVFEEVFPYLAEGFIHHYKQKHGSKNEITQEKLDVVFQATLTLLYRILFLLYAESRDLLPVKEARGFFEISLTKLRNEIAERAGGIRDEAETKIKNHYNKTATELYDRLAHLFRIIDRGDANNNVPVYNGELFSSEPSPLDEEKEQIDRFLIDYKIPDYFLVLGLDLITRDIDDKTHSLVFIDYKSLGVRHLGSIYEGLLEFKVRIAPQKMAIVRGNKTEEVIPYSEAKKDPKKKIVTVRRNGKKVEKVYAKGTLYLENDKRERKATGSYYTPDYIVKYIVENTVGPVLEERFDKLAPEFRKAQQWNREQTKKREGRKELRGRLALKAQEAEGDVKRFRPLIDEFFDVNVLDPAMGSGHFLVEAVDYISDRMIHFLNGFRWNPVHVDLDDTRVTILEAMEKQDIAIDSKKLDPNNLIRRYVLKRCIYGVDINPMAVELAKVSLWLNCFTLGAPLSFLDHHLKCGNSLIGVTVDEVRQAIEGEKGQTYSLFGGGFTGLMLATDLMRHVGELSDVTANQVEESKREYRKAESGLAPFKRLLDVYTSQWFGNEARKVGRGKAKHEVNPAVEFLQSEHSEKWTKDPEQIKLNGENQKVAETALQAAKERRFFHWELEFPEVFYEKGGKKDDGGFDAVVGNPPYGNADSMSSEEQSTIAARFSNIFNRQNDICYYFVSLGNEVLKPNREICLIIARYFIDAKNAKKLRNFIAGSLPISLLVDFGDYQVWPNINILTVIVKFIRAKHRANLKFIDLKGIDKENKIKERLTNISALIISSPEGSQWRLGVSDRLNNLMNKLDLKCQYLGDKFTVGQGLTTGRNDIFIIDDKVIKDHNIEKELLCPYVKTQDIKRYNIEWRGLFLLEIRSNIEINKYPNALNYLSRFRDELSKRYEVRKDKGTWWSISVPRNIELLHKKSKILTPLYSTHNSFAIDTNIPPFISLTDVYAIDCGFDTDPYFVLAILNSNLLNKLRTLVSKRKRGGYWEFSRQTLDRLPIVIIKDTTPVYQKKELKSELINCYNVHIEKYNYGGSEFIELIDKLLIPKDKNSNSDTKIKYDVLHDILVLLSKCMVSNKSVLNDGIKEFTKYVDIKLSSKNLFSKTTKHQTKYFVGDYRKNESHVPFEDLVRFIQKNKSKIDVNLNQPGLLKELEREYEKSLEMLLPIKQRLALTDKLIDQIVYRLYGLTEEDIRVVEGEKL